MKNSVHCRGEVAKNVMQIQSPLTYYGHIGHASAQRHERPFVLSRALTEEEQEQIRLRVHNCDLMINQITSNAVDAESYQPMAGTGENTRLL
jgi:hypothetical protein